MKYENKFNSIECEEYILQYKICICTSYIYNICTYATNTNNGMWFVF